MKIQETFLPLLEGKVVANKFNDRFRIENDILLCKDHCEDTWHKHTGGMFSAAEEPYEIIDNADKEVHSLDEALGLVNDAKAISISMPDGKPLVIKPPMSRFEALTLYVAFDKGWPVWKE